MSGAATTIAVIGAGGLGGPIARSLAAAGYGVRVVDPDVVELSNLQRQVQFTGADLGAPKATALAAAITRRHAGARAHAIVGRFDAASAAAILDGVDAVVDGTDSPDAKFAVGDAAVARGLPHVIAGALRYGGNVFTGGAHAACYRCLFEAPPGDADAPTCADAGIFGPVCAVIGGLAARELLRLLAGDHAHAGTILVVDDLRRGLAPRRVRFRPRAGCSCAVRIASAS
jgi:molybdopterin/thiamine biosynthesis adenylyltransferase